MKKLQKVISDSVSQMLSDKADIRVNEEVHKEYISYHGKVNIEEHDKTTIVSKSNKLLFDPKTPAKIQKKLLFLLGHYAIVSPKQIYRYYKIW